MIVLYLQHVKSSFDFGNLCHFNSLKVPICNATSSEINARLCNKCTEFLLSNYLNGGTNKGQADGFNLEALSKLSSTKDAENKTTLLDYVIELAKIHYPEQSVSLCS